MEIITPGAAWRTFKDCEISMNKMDVYTIYILINISPVLYNR